MKIAYIIDWNIIANSGVLNKVAAKIMFWESEGHEVHLCIVSNNTQNEFIPQNIQHVKVFEQPQMNLLIASKLKTYFGRYKAFKSLYHHVKELDVDVIYFRQTRWYQPMNDLFKCAPTIMEANSDDLSEKKLNSGKINQQISFYGNKKLIKIIKGVVGVTNEITNLYKAGNLKTITISNGIEVNENLAPYKKQPEPQLIFVGSPGQKWHGVEKVYTMAARLPEFIFHVVGPEKPSNINYKNIVFHGYLNSEKIASLYKIIDVGIGTLSLYLKKMSEACPLKVREYLSYGIPVIAGYKDVDVDGQHFTLNIGNYENNVLDNIDKIKVFVNEFHGKRIPKRIINPLIDLKAKEKKRLAFIQEFIEEK